MKHVKDVQLTKTFTPDLYCYNIYGFQYIMETIVDIDRNGDCKSRTKIKQLLLKKMKYLKNNNECQILWHNFFLNKVK